MRVLWLPFAAGLATGLFACGGDDPLELGAQCDFTTDCAEPYVCRIGRCRVECISSRDCPPGAVCLDDNDGRGACRLPPEAECTTDADCPTILVCGEGRCRNQCTEDSDCPDGLCEELASDLRTCAEPSEDDAGTPDAGPLDAGPPADGGPAPTDAGPPTAQTCTTDADCGPDMSCDSLRGEDSICRPTCDTDIGDSDCPGDTICMTVSSGVSAVGVCTHRCAIGTTDGCPSNATCDLFSETRATEKVFFSECRAFDAADECDPCTAGTATACDDGQTCTYQHDMPRCLFLCTDDTDCTAPLKCKFWSDHPTIEGVEYKRCLDDAAALCSPGF